MVAEPVRPVDEVDDLVMEMGGVRPCVTALLAEIDLLRAEAEIMRAQISAGYIRRGLGQ